MPTIDIPDKICPHCGGTKWHIMTDKYTKKDGTISLCTWYLCHVKRYEYSKKSKLKNSKKYREINKKASAKRRLTEKFKIWNSDYQKKLVINNYPLYTARIIVKNNDLLNWRDIPQDVIELHRKQLILKRKIKNNAKDQSSDNNHTDSNN